MQTNHLATEQSPYLLQHAHNPVNWYPWGEDAFHKARTEDKPIFLSIGYSTCHWCHVMERESFENAEIAAILNQHFISVKVDREERPDVDRIYMSFVQATTGGGGWPMSVWLTPDLKPFYGGTYFPPEDRYGRPGFASVLRSIANAWQSQRDKILESSGDITSQLAKHLEVLPSRSGAPLDPQVLDAAFYAFRRSFDPRYGGFGEAPKFPRPSVFEFLLRYYARTNNSEALDMVLKTLDAMAKGGMHDQIGGGFHRYSVDARWFVPHFEKMLYDQAQLAVSYVEAFQITREPRYAEIARKTLEYVMREMTSPGGAFYSAEDADSGIDPAQPNIKGEGAFYIWTRTEVEEVLGAERAEWFCYRFGIEADGNVREDPHGEFTGKNILSESHSIEETAAHFGRSAEELARALEDAGRKLLAARSRRLRPHLDDKVLTAWNGLMISAFARAGSALADQRYTGAAQQAASFILEHLYDTGSGTLLRRYRSEDAAIPGFLDDYAFFAQALLDLYEANFDLRYLELAIRLTDRMRELFEDRGHGGFFSTAAGDSRLILRIKDDYDGAEPSGNSIAALNLLRLARMTGRQDYHDSADRVLAAFASRISAAPAGVPQMLAALEFRIAKPSQIVLVGEKHSPDLEELEREREDRFLPNTVVLLVDEESRSTLASWVPGIAEMRKLDGRAAAYVCEDFTCQLPTADRARLGELLQ